MLSINQMRMTSKEEMLLLERVWRWPERPWRWRMVWPWGQVGHLCAPVLNSAPAAPLFSCRLPKLWSSRSGQLLMASGLPASCFGLKEICGAKGPFRNRLLKGVSIDFYSNLLSDYKNLFLFHIAFYNKKCKVAILSMLYNLWNILSICCEASIS